MQDLDFIDQPLSSKRVRKQKPEKEQQIIFEKT